MSKKRPLGFTLVELMIATTIFSAILLLGLAAFVQIGRMYYKGITSAKTQEAARSVLDQVAQAIQLSSAGVRGAKGYNGVGGVTSGDICIGDNHYSFVADKQLSNPKDPSLASTQSKHVLWVETVNDCSNTAGLLPRGVDVDDPGGVDSRELLGSKMRLTRFIVEPLPGTTNLYSVQVSVAYGDDDLLNPPDVNGRRSCKGAYAGTQFCAVSDLTTVIKKRI